MKIAHKLGIVAAAGALTIGGAASAFAAGSAGPTTTAVGGGNAAKAFLCAHLPEVQAQQQLKEQLLAGRLTLLQEAKDAATAANKPTAVARIDKRIAKNAAATTKLQAREAKLLTACATPTPAAPTEATG
ncbi:MAG: hypothetical protein JWM12_4011 [Ilumatobacteraceae bacterium]|nr:hypothetical protein [Ilumatobacteraceae bacterium]